MPLHVSSTCAHHQEVKIALHSLWYHHTETSEWYKITKIQFYKYEQIVVKFMCEFFGCDYCVLLTIKKMQLYTVYFICKLLYMFRVFSPAIIRSTNNCIYSIWYWSTVAATCRYHRGVETSLNSSTVICAHDDRWRKHPKHVQKITDKINCV